MTGPSTESAPEEFDRSLLFFPPGSLLYHNILRRRKANPWRWRREVAQLFAPNSFAALSITGITSCAEFGSHALVHPADLEAYLARVNCKRVYA